MQFEVALQLDRLTTGSFDRGGLSLSSAKPVLTHETFSGRADQVLKSRF